MFDLTDGRNECKQFSLPEIEMLKLGCSDAESVIRVLNHCYHVFNPGRYVCKLESSACNFVHCSNGTAVSRQFSQICHLMLEHAQLDFVRDCVFRLKSIALFCKDLEVLVNNEYRKWHKIMHNFVTEAPDSKLCCLTTVCDDLRVHMNHWNCIKQRWHTDRWLNCSHCAGLDVDFVRHTLLQLRDSAFGWIERLIKIGLEVFAHSDLESMGQDMLWNVLRGLEEFNSLVTLVQTPTDQEQFRAYHISTLQDNQKDSQLTSAYSNSVAHIPNSLHAVPFLRVLSIIAKERAQYASLKAHRFFTTNDEFVTLIHHNRLPAYNWGDRFGSTSVPVRKSAPNSLNQLDSDSDCFSTSNRTSTGRKSNEDFDLLLMNSVLVPDLSTCVSPLVDYAEQEEDFIGRLLDVSSSTKLLRKKGSPDAVSSQKARTVIHSSPFRGPRGPVNEAALARSDLKRKCVSWGDSSDSCVHDQVVARYMETLWQSFGSSLKVKLDDPLWGIDEDFVDSELGGVTLCCDMALVVLVHLIRFSCITGVFPKSSLPDLQLVCHSFHHTFALTAWQTLLWQALGSSVYDKCYPCPLGGGLYSSKTGKLLRDSFHLLLSVVTDQSWPDASINKGIAPMPCSDLGMVVSLSSRLLVTCRLSLQWCSTKIYQFLASWTIASFLLITQGDLKVLTDETKRCLQLSQTVLSLTIGSRTSVQTPVIQQLSTICQELHDCGQHIETLSGTALIMFGAMCRAKSINVLEETMPLGKIWRRKPSEEPLYEHSLYTEQMLEVMLEPVVEGVSKLPVTSQVEVMTAATEAVCDAWTGFILKKEIRFSLGGAAQLSLDFCLLKTWLGQYIGNTQVKQSILNLSIFRKLNGIIQLLLQQPKKRTRDICFIDDMSCEESVHSSQESVAPHSTSNNVEEQSDVSFVENREAWLALRLNRSSGWRLSSCFATPSAKV